MTESQRIETWGISGNLKCHAGDMGREIFEKRDVRIRAQSADMPQATGEDFLMRQD